ncbi:hypothetical protein L5515_004514 [Caenorhabditis briggsae]|uniref:Alpha-1,3-mannosyl-glycoprotein 2-beta-N-acetylglucosaminyltransferase n=1 Tax=Caenorhabditis briggsae TaxID=6238 RepID=A0AAE9DDE9_CAEBR|nr:hypothetical protein L3Y34_001672 [Caenorhabditis briggsae]UMM24136.1 hypothetical protein L5515_004514 [Caenorhabditis briggsae]
MQDSTLITIIFIFFYFSWNFYLHSRLVYVNSNDFESEEILNNFEEAEKRLNAILHGDHERLNDMWEIVRESIPKRWTEPIPVLVFACNRPAAIRDHLEKLIRLRPSKESFPITVSQDCDSSKVADEVKKFGDQVEYIKHTPGINANIKVPPRFKKKKSYFYISRHYKLALTHMFSKNPYSTVLITEDDLDIAPDFFSYFSSTRHLLEKDPNLYCVSAWNDNGKLEHIDWNANATLYRSDFFGGLGWMMARRQWEEFEPTWPAVFWDDWMRDPAQRKGRQCIRPEISRTGMMIHGKKGVSNGQFYADHLSKIKMSNFSINFEELNLNYLLPNNFKNKMDKDLADAVLVELENITSSSWKPEVKNLKVKIVYTGKAHFVNITKELGIMNEFRSGIPRTAYNGIVTCFFKKTRLFLVPDRSKVPIYD